MDIKHELDSKFYDNAYLSADKYNVHYSKSPYKEVWDKVLSLCKGKKVADFGCGVGQTAEMLIDNRVDYSYGVDFSAVGIEKCKRLDANFYCLSLHDDVYNLKPYDVGLFLEVLEHVEQDRQTIKKLPIGSEVILTVPNWDSSSHVRYFNSLKQVRKRYKFLTELHVKEFKIGKGHKRIYLLHGVR